jgi:hypothetical protein
MKWKPLPSDNTPSRNERHREPVPGWYTGALRLAQQRFRASMKIPKLFPD